MSTSADLVILLIAGGLLVTRGRATFGPSSRRRQRRVEQAQMDAWLEYIIEETRTMAEPKIRQHRAV
jgi:hypothetical protein